MDEVGDLLVYVMAFSLCFAIAGVVTMLVDWITEYLRRRR